MILVTGATGYVGTHVVRELRGKGMAVRCVVRAAATEEQTALLRQWGAEIVRAELTDANAIGLALDGVDAVVHLAGSIRPTSGETPRQIHVENTLGLVRAARGRPVRIFVLVSALGARPDASTPYHRTKWEAEEVVRNSGIPYVILRPSLIFGRLVGLRDSKLVARMSQAILSGSRIPLVGGGQHLVQPVFIGDVTQCVLACLERQDLAGRCFDLCGPEQMTFEELIDTLAKHYHKTAIKRNLPFVPVFLLAVILERCMKAPPFTSTEVRLMRESNTCAPGNWTRCFGIEPISLERGLSFRAASAELNVRANAPWDDRR
jgi:uncharacterized protein YbjT (DUF2867 family)